MLQTHRRCTRCGQIKPVDAYMDSRRATVCLACRDLRVHAAQQRGTAAQSVRRTRRRLAKGVISD
jgi:hypothetical protein